MYVQYFNLKNLKIFMIWKTDINFFMQADWNMYQAIKMISITNKYTKQTLKYQNITEGYIKLSHKKCW